MSNVELYIKFRSCQVPNFASLSQTKICDISGINAVSPDSLVCRAILTQRRKKCLPASRINYMQDAKIVKLIMCR